MGLIGILIGQSLTVDLLSQWFTYVSYCLSRDWLWPIWLNFEVFLFLILGWRCLTNPNSQRCPWALAVSSEDMSSTDGSSSQNITSRRRSTTHLYLFYLLEPSWTRIYTYICRPLRCGTHTYTYCMTYTHCFWIAYVIMLLLSQELFHGTSLNPSTSTVR